MKAAPTSTNRLGRGWGVWGGWERGLGGGALQTRFKRREVLKTEPSVRATPARCNSPRPKTQDERIRLGGGGSGDKLARGSQDESK